MVSPVLEPDATEFLASNSRAFLVSTERDGAPTQVVLPYFRARKIAIMTPLRSEDELKKLSSAAERQ